MTEPTKLDLEAFKDLSIEELQEMQDKLKGFVEKRKQNRRKDALQQIRSLVAEYELSYDEVVQAIRVSAKRGKAPAIYRNPEKPRQTWSGKGEAPEWYVKAKNKEALRIPGA